MTHAPAHDPPHPEKKHFATDVSLAWLERLPQDHEHKWGYYRFKLWTNIYRRTYYEPNLSLVWNI